ncbi:hypothetical protein IMY05_C4560000100 [Salix suchowensis]|nr:hypothetical protein IMY05_C4560000100 [Salix suchowensis]
MVLSSTNRARTPWPTLRDSTSNNETHSSHQTSHDPPPQPQSRNRFSPIARPCKAHSAAPCIPSRVTVKRNGTPILVYQLATGYADHATSGMRFMQPRQSGVLLTSADPLGSYNALELGWKRGWPALPDFVNGQNPYETALALTRVSSDVRRAAMPGFLHTVVISNPRQLYAFLEAVRRSRSQRQPRRLDIHCDYAQMVRRFWCTDGPHRLLSDPTVLDYATLYEVIRNVDSLGMTFVTLPMLTDCFAEGRNIQKEWKCRSLVLVGPGDRWNPLVNSPEGVVFLSKLTHLVVYNLDGASTNSLPAAVARIPFAAMPSLTHFAFPMLAQARGGIFPMAAIVSADRQALRQFVNAPANYSSPRTFDLLNGTVVESTGRQHLE